MEDTRFVVVGAGVTGLAFANHAPDALVLERDASPGGYCKTIRRAGFVWDYSGHFFHFRHPEIEHWLRARMDAEEVETIVKSSGILFDGVRIDFPFQKNIHQLPKDHFVQCLHDLYFRDADREVETFEDMLYAKFGRGIADRFLVPYNEKLYACPMNRLDPDAMGRFFPHADIEQIIRNFVASDNAGYNATFTYPRGGAIRYIGALMHDLPAERVRLNEGVRAIDLDRRVVTTTSGAEIRYEHLISSMPFPKLLAMTKTEHDPAIYTWNKVLCFNLGFDRKGQSKDHWLYIPSRDISFYRVGFYDNIFGTDRMSLYIEIGLSADAEIGDLKPRLDRVLRDLDTLGITDGHQLVAHHSVVMDPAYVHITKASRADFAKKCALLEAHGVHSIGRYGGWTYCSIEDNIVEARALASKLTES